MKKIIFFSHNANKIKEVKKLFEETGINILTLYDFPNISEPKETGSTFEENAKIKSSYGYKKIQLPCFADDSGICIGALDNFPGPEVIFLDDFSIVLNSIISRPSIGSIARINIASAISLKFVTILNK